MNCWVQSCISTEVDHCCAVYVDSENGVNIDDCSKISSQIGAVFDVEDPLSGAYLLEVSSPGLDRPLFKLDHYKRFVGRSLKLRLRAAYAGQRNFKGQNKNG